MMKKIYLLLLFLGGMIGVLGQNAIVGSGFAPGWGGACNQRIDFQYFGTSTGTSYISTRTANGTGLQYFRLAVDFGGSIYQVTKTIGSDVDVVPNIVQDLTMTCTTSGAMRINVPNTFYNYVFKTKNAGSTPEGKFLLFEVQGAVQNISSVTQSPSTPTVNNTNTVTVTANLSAVFATGQAAYLRYTTNNFSASTVVKMTGSGSTRTANIPVFPTGTVVKYYVFTSGDGTVGSSDGPASDGSDADFRTINLNNNGGSNYTYTVLSSESITTSTISGTEFCAGSSVNVPFTVSGTFNAGNIFTAQLSDAAGSFAAPTTIGTVSSTTSGTISATIPTGTVYGTGYKVRVISTTPAVTGSESTTFTIYPKITDAKIQSPKTATICDNVSFKVFGRVEAIGLTNNTADSGIITAKFGYGTSTDPTTWTYNLATYNVQGASIELTKAEYNYTIPPGTFTAGVSYYYGFSYQIGSCTLVYGGQDGIITVPADKRGVLTVTQATKITTQPTPSQTVDVYTYVALSAVASANAAGPLTYQWYKNTTNSNSGGTPISGETNATFEPDTYVPGTFYYYLIASTGGGTCDFAISNPATIVVNNSSTVNWANIQSPKREVTNVYEGIGVAVFAQVYVPGSTDVTAGQASPPNLAWIGYSTTPTNPNTWPEAQWQVAAYNPYQAVLTANNDEYFIPDFLSDLPTGIYYVASRFQKAGGGAYVYGGTEDTDNNESGGIWQVGKYKSLKINVDKTITWLQDTPSTGKWNYPPSPPPAVFPPGPTIKTPVLIATNVSNPPSFETKELRINNGVSLTIPSGNYVKVKGAILNANGTNAPETLVVKSDANLIQVDNITNTSKITAERSVTNINNNLATYMDYVYWSSPVAGQTTKGTAIGAFSPGTPANRFFSYLETNDRFYETGDTTFTPGRGYAVRAETGTNPDTGLAFVDGYSKIYNFKGIPSNGDISFPIIKSADNPVGTVHGFNLVGNPYPSNIDFDKLYANNANGALIYGTVYFWTNTGTYVKDQMGSTYPGNNYAYYNTASGGNPPTGGSYQTAPNGIIKVGQGFIVQKKVNGTAPLLFKNSYGTGQDLRVSTSGTFYQKQSETKNRFWINLTSPDNVVNTQLIAYVAGGTNDFNQYEDSESWGLSADLFYSIIDGKQLLIQGRDENFTIDDKVQLGANFFKDGTYKIALDHGDGIFGSAQHIYLKDNQAGTYTDLSSEPYTFAATKGISEGRFEIVYKRGPLATTDATKSNLQIYRDAGEFIIKATQKITNVELYDASGRLILKLNPNKEESRISANQLLNGVFILKINLMNGEVVTRKIRN